MALTDVLPRRSMTSGAEGIASAFDLRSSTYRLQGCCGRDKIMPPTGSFDPKQSLGGSPKRITSRQLVGG